MRLDALLLTTQVWLCTEEGERLAFATSWWAAGAVRLKSFTLPRMTQWPAMFVLQAHWSCVTCSPSNGLIFPFSSIIDDSQEETLLANRGRPIGENFAQSRRESFRQLTSVYTLCCPCATRDAVGNLHTSTESAGSSEKVTSECEELWARHYVVWRDGRAVSVILEVFLPSLYKYLGGGPAVLKDTIE